MRLGSFVVEISLFVALAVCFLTCIVYGSCAVIDDGSYVVGIAFDAYMFLLLLLLIAAPVDVLHVHDHVCVPVIIDV